MNDREMLELAAKAVGLKPRRYFSGFGLAIEGAGDFWNPLTNDGDALRLTVKLGLHIHRTHTAYGDYWSASVGFPVSETCMQYVHEALGKNPHQATRRAIVRAAAEIGKPKEAAA